MTPPASHRGRAAREADLVRPGERGGQRVAVHAEPHGVRARLEHGDDAASRPLEGRCACPRYAAVGRPRSSRRSGGARSRRRGPRAPAPRSSMRHAAELAERAAGHLHRDAGCGAAAMAANALSTLWPPMRPQRTRPATAPVVQHLEVRVVRARARRPRRTALAREALARAPAAHRERTVEMGVVYAVHDEAGAGHGAQVVELPLDRLDIGIDVRVVVFEVVEDAGARPVVDELGALVETRCRTRRPR